MKESIKAELWNTCMQQVGELNYAIKYCERKLSTLTSYTPAQLDSYHEQFLQERKKSIEEFEDKVLKYCELKKLTYAIYDYSVRWYAYVEAKTVEKALQTCESLLQASLALMHCMSICGEKYVPMKLGTTYKSYNNEDLTRRHNLFVRESHVLNQCLNEAEHV